MEGPLHGASVRLSFSLIVGQLIDREARGLGEEEYEELKEKVEMENNSIWN